MNGVRVVDSHVHLGEWPSLDLNFSLEEFKIVMAQYDYSGAVVMPHIHGNATQANEGLLKAVEGQSNLYPFVWVEPNEPLLTTWLQQRRPLYRGLKFHASISQKTLDDPSMEAVLEFADKERLPLLYHCGRNVISSPSFVKLIVPRYPRIKFILAHMGGNAYDQIFKTMRLFETGLPENVYFDTSTARHPDLLRKAVDCYGLDRLLFGTDLPFTDQRLNFDCLRYAGLLNDEAFMGGNLLRLLK